MSNYNKYEVTIIVPVYNVEKYLNKCIDSILSQTFNNFELILIDDGSTDSSGNICDEYLNKDKRVKVIHKENGGVSSARNAGLDIAKGKYISFVDSDDYISDYYIEKLYNNIKDNNADISICGCNGFLKEKENNLNNIIYDIDILESKDALLKLYNVNTRFIYVTVYLKMYKKSLFDNIRFPLGKINEDSFIIYKLYLKSNKIIYNNSKLYFYRNRQGSIMRQKFTKRNFDDLEALEEQIDYFRRKEYYDLEKASIKYYCYHLKGFYRKFKEDKSNIKEINMIKDKHKNIKNYIKDKEYYSIDETDFINAPWCSEKLLEPYWYYIVLKKKLYNCIHKILLKKDTV